MSDSSQPSAEAPIAELLAIMARLRDLGRHKAERPTGPWWPLSKIA